MTNRLQRANELLEFVTHALDEVVEILAGADPPAVQEASKLVDEATLTLSHVQQVLYAHVPVIAPAWKDDPELGAEMRAYGKLLVTTRNLWAADRYEEALQVWRDFLATEPFYSFDLLGRRMLAHLEKIVAEIAARPDVP